MHWYEWVFSGIGVLFVGYFIQRWVRSGHGNETTLKVRGATVSASPVASGSGITQTVNSPTTVNVGQMSVGQTATPALPKLNIEIREVCFDQVLESLSPDWSDYTFEIYVFVFLWVVNTTTVPTTVKKWELTLSGDGKTRAAAEVSDFSKWFQHIKRKVREPYVGSEGYVIASEGYVIAEERKTLTVLPAQPFQHGIPCQGWVCFKVYGITHAMLKDTQIQLCIADSFGQEHRTESPAPLACRGSMVNPELP